MQMEDLLAACLDAQERGRAPGEILDRSATPDQRVELEPLLALATRLRHLAPPPLRRERREAMAGRLAIAMQMPVTSSAARTWA